MINEFMPLHDVGFRSSIDLKMSLTGYHYNFAYISPEQTIFLTFVEERKWCNTFLE